MAELIEVAAELSVGGTSYTLLSARCHEALSEVGSLECELTDNAGGPDPASLIGMPVELVLAFKDGSARRSFGGFIVEAELTSGGSAERGARIVAAPKLWRLGQRASCRSFQEMSAPDIVKKVLGEAGIPAGDQDYKLRQSYKPRVYTTQYRESDLDFVARLLSEEGITFTVEQDAGKERVVFLDSDLGPIEGPSELPVRLASGLNAPGEAVVAIEQVRSLRSGKVCLRDYDFERPKLLLETKAEGKDSAEKALEVYAYPGRFTDKAVGDRYARTLLESIQAGRDVVTGETTSLRLRPGQRFSIAEHPYEPLNREYLIVTVEHRYAMDRWGGGSASGDEARAGCSFTAIPAATPYRPPRLDRARPLAGVQTAITTGAPGSEIFPDKHGRIKVLFPWDRQGKKDDTSSPWIRTSQLPLGGSMLTPRVGWEVAVGYTEGDPDAPLAFGRVYNAVSRPPYALPGGKTRMALQTATTPGGGSVNELRMDDAAGNEEMFFNASKDMSVGVGNNTTESVGNNESREVGANHALNVTGSVNSTVGGSQTLTVSGNQAVQVSTYMVDDMQGSHTLTIGGNRDLTVGGDHKREIKGSSVLTIGGNQIDLVVGSVSESTLSTMTDSVGAALAEITLSDRTVHATGARTEKAGAVKAVICKGGRGVTVGGSLNHNVTAGILNKTSAGRFDSSEGSYLEVAGGAQIIKASGEVVFEASELLSVVMGASTLTLTPASVSIAGVSIKFDGDTSELAALVTDN